MYNFDSGYIVADGKGRSIDQRELVCIGHLARRGFAKYITLHAKYVHRHYENASGILLLDDVVE